MLAKQKSFRVKLHDQTQTFSRSLWLPYLCPFLAFIALTLAAPCFPGWEHLLYFIKILITGGLLWFWRESYAMDIAPRVTPAGYLAAVAAGLLVLPVWILPEAFFPWLGAEGGFNPYAFGWPPTAVPALIALRIAGAVLVVPVMEEIFWRSFVLRYLVHPNFSKVPLGTFTWFSFCLGVIMFGLEHRRWIQGIIAGSVYALLVIQQKSLRGSIIAHATTNLGLGVYVAATQSWGFW